MNTSISVADRAAAAQRIRNYHHVRSSETSAHREKFARQICTLIFSDGQRVTAQISARSRHEDSPVVFGGAVERLPFAFDVADSVLLRACFQSFARELKAKLVEELLGEWAVDESAYRQGFVGPGART